MIDRKEAERDNAIILHNIISEVAAKTKAPVQQSDDDAKTLMEYIDSNYTTDVTNKYLANIIGKSESQTIRIFKKAFMKTPYEYVIEKRLEAAKQMLGSTGLSVRDIAYALGFSNEHYFSSCFKAHEGITPLGYKKSIC
jgi:transcriptional regulator GlxA family with amidase domain